MGEGSEWIEHGWVLVHASVKRIINDAVRIGRKDGVGSQDSFVSLSYHGNSVHQPKH